MRSRSGRALLAAAVAIVIAGVGIVSSAQADTTIPGLNGRIAYTTNAAETQFLDSPTTRQVKCATFPTPLASLFLADFTNSVLFPFNSLSCEAEIATINPDGTGFAQVTNDTTDPVQDDAPAWLPQDGSKIAYQSLRNEDGCQPFLAPKGVLTSACLWNIWSIAPDGTGNTQLTGLTTDVLQAQHPSFSPDGSRIAFEALNPSLIKGATTRDFGVSAGIEDLSHAGQAIFTMPAGGTTTGTPTQVEPSSEVGFLGDSFVSDFQPTFSPDGTKIAFTRLTVTNITPTAASKVALQEFSFSSSIYVAPAAGGPATAVETTPDCTVSLPFATAPSRAATPRGSVQMCVWDSTPAWSPDGSKLAATRTTFPSFFLSPVAPAQKGLVAVGEDADIIAFNSSDGSGLADLSKVVEPADCNTTIDSGTTCALDEKPAWSPDGTKIAFFSNRDSSGLFPITQCEQEDAALCDDEIWTMNVDGTSPFQVTTNDVNDINPDWQRIPPPPAPPVTPPVTPAAVPPKIGVAGVRRACVSKAFHVRFHIATTSSSVKSVVVKLDGRRIKSTSKGSFTLSINAKKLKSGRHRLTIRATDSNGHVTTTHKSFSVCKAAKPRRRTAPRFTG
ncbi:MAG TPA: hypothetical protein VF032_06520 [Thermoleophilaceae bacterium]